MHDKPICKGGRHPAIEPIPTNDESGAIPNRCDPPPATSGLAVASNARVIRQRRITASLAQPEPPFTNSARSPPSAEPRQQAAHQPSVSSAFLSEQRHKRQAMVSAT
ncbi:hypothetical protein EWB00_000775 [Schistosoma japonicum]|uniref:Uncharacterized protein n=1 Tax=Schistosoma japonicum TaxID=6182 RepID=A0A4Z2CK78_SCHJA|nr:hypothetical protein EWB00_000775 [Schistosoma japonicum]